MGKWQNDPAIREKALKSYAASCETARAEYINKVNRANDCRNSVRVDDGFVMDGKRCLVKSINWFTIEYQSAIFGPRYTIEFAEFTRRGCRIIANDTCAIDFLATYERKETGEPL